MLPPIIPLSAAPVTSQQDPVKPTPDIPPVVPAQPASSDGTVDLKHQRDPQEQALLLREEQRRQQQRRQKDQDERYSALPGDELNADNTVPVAPLGERTRQGLLVDIEV
ncbi:aspartate-semialdehyde dehydrogenase [Pseudomonas juntendi]|uniref:Aspartate-semialdehyde dehydrogenase n=1 Tax=Pseudomonas putida TaxID=303 RepID=A0A1X0ZYZ1_PSEPU|nr:MULTISPECIES: aspartate-semialdehyde dehydrogenase [Pseudomonas]EKT4465895.1 aspartate-semialdehyde dehydrogenase [Pseudomonas putida]EKT4524486.1 aspartate-semialdehyde dehydrogenase [Pseudomonas putida]MEB3901492.1 aspartate-semialdehyde dehydrogenase [Pseudomonas putida]ORL64847.1 aspartate-semialdehyde dehydrogenase [Pseudomonas putida]UBM26417.1 aspartate-semialdehyde dehydrogenase [Pseudomonas sp. p1(2021b)]